MNAVHVFVKVILQTLLHDVGLHHHGAGIYIYERQFMSVMAIQETQQGGIISGSKALLIEVEGCWK